MCPSRSRSTDYRARAAQLDVTGGAVVSGSFQAYDQTYLIDALEQLGAGLRRRRQRPGRTSPTARCWRSTPAASARTGSTCSAAATSRQIALAPRFAELVRLAPGGLCRRPATCPSWRRGWRRSPRLVIDHLGMTQTSTAVLGLVKAGAYVKASGFGRDRARDVALRAAGDRRRQPRRAAVRLRPPLDPRAAPVPGRGHRARARGRGPARAVRQRARALRRVT